MGVIQGEYREARRTTSVGDLLLIPLTIIFGIALVVFVYVAGYSWYLGGPAVDQGLPWLYSSAIASGASLFVLSYVYHAKRHKEMSPSQRLLLALFDLVTFFCGTTLILWGLVLPILRPISPQGFQLYLLNQQSLALGLYTGLVLCSLVVVFRVALQFLIVQTVAVAPIIKTPNPPVAQIVESKDKGIEDSLSLIRSEIASLREEITSIGSTRIGRTRSEFTIGSSGENSGWSSVGNPEPVPFAISQASPLPISPPPVLREHVKKPVENAGVQDSDAPPLLEYEPTISDIQLPDSAKNNPWASVLSRRQGRFVPAPPPISSEADEPAPQEANTSSPLTTDATSPVTTDPIPAFEAANSILVLPDPVPSVAGDSTAPENIVFLPPPDVNSAPSEFPDLIPPASADSAQITTESAPEVATKMIQPLTADPTTPDPNSHAHLEVNSIPTENSKPVLPATADIIRTVANPALPHVVEDPVAAPDPFEGANPVSLVPPPAQPSAASVAPRTFQIKIKGVNARRTRKGKAGKTAKSSSPTEKTASDAKDIQSTDSLPTITSENE